MIVTSNGYKALQQKSIRWLTLIARINAAFLDEGRPIVLVMDNGSYHHSQMSEAMLAF